jgi:DNA-binding transcriptional LysR family regulator
MPETLPSLSTDQLAAFVELARTGSLRAAAAELHVTEQGLRSRLIALEARLSVQLYHKQRGVRRGAVLTEQGRRFLPHATAFLEHARDLGELFDTAASPKQVHVAASQYLTYYVLIDAVKRFHAAEPTVRIRLSTQTERQVEATLMNDPAVTIGISAPFEPATELAYAHLFSMVWSVIAPMKHPLLKRRRLRLEHLADQPLIAFERGSTGRQHVLDAFHGRGLSPRIEMEATSTQVIVAMVEAGLGVSIVPLLPNGAVTKGRRVGARGLGAQIRPIQSGVLTRRGEPLSDAAQRFVRFVRDETRGFGV